MKEEDAPPEPSEDEDAPKGTNDAPVEGSTRNFSLKLESWMSEALTSDLAAPPPSAQAPVVLDEIPKAPVVPPAAPIEPLAAPAMAEAEKPIALESSPFAPTATGRFVTAPSQKKGGGKALPILLVVLLLALAGVGACVFLLRTG